MDDFNNLTKQIIDWVVGILPGLALALVVLVVGLWVIKKLAGVLEMTLNRS